jgi:hypothetical protein
MVPKISPLLPTFKNGKATEDEVQNVTTDNIQYTSSDGTRYNINPNVVNSSELKVTVPEVVVTGQDKRPLYQRYDAYNSAYNSDLAK